MAKGRMLNKKISVDEQVSSLSVEAALLYTWCIAHLDIEGRIHAEPEILKGTVVPYIKRLTIEKIKSCISEIESAGLALHYGNGKKYMQFKGFKTNQSLRPDREGKSNIPAPETMPISSDEISKITPTPGVVQENSGKTPAQEKLNIREVNINNYKGKKPLLGDFEKLNIDLTPLTKELEHFAIMRKTLRKPLTIRSFELIVDRTYKLSKGDINAAIAILQQSIENSWLTTYPLKRETASKLRNVGDKYDKL